ncbi:aldo/keto reductase [Azohydromonas lata]|uniref:Aldo/keto reductase n=1 Tax=Azohydromonas lata TaxID=45677 RepID=A0ABU5IQP4_9BURK|nr:aldo/keto reductase [Azohydromonas lata]MDZ5461215.1 aldo/keto reductase [Azohydromonas lata]
MSKTTMPRRRRVLGGLAALAAGAAPGWLAPSTAAAQGSPALPLRAIPSSRERLPAVGLGTWITFNVGRDAQLREECTRVVEAFLAGGGRLIDSSPMYGSAQEVVGQALRTLGARDRVFAADKVWSSSGRQGPAQIDESRAFWGLPRFDLLQVHNLLAWEEQLPLLLRMKAQGRLRYVGVTTSEGRRHAEMERVMAGKPLDFVQLTYNPVDREAEQRLLPLAAERGMGVIVNRPFQQGALLRRLERHPLPKWAGPELDATSWAQLVLKFIVAHPAVTCVIPATTQVAHVRENLAAAGGRLPDAALRRRIAQAVQEL